MVWYLSFFKISENHERFAEKVDSIAQFHLQDPDPDSKYESGSSLAILIRIRNTELISP